MSLLCRCHQPAACNHTPTSLMLHYSHLFRVTCPLSIGIPQMADKEPNFRMRSSPWHNKRCQYGVSLHCSFQYILWLLGVFMCPLVCVCVCKCVCMHRFVFVCGWYVFVCICLSQTNLKVLSTSENSSMCAVVRAGCSNTHAITTKSFTQAIALVNVLRIW